jgi:hypothetical protein
MACPCHSTGTLHAQRLQLLCGRPLGPDRPQPLKRPPPQPTHAPRNARPPPMPTPRRARPRPTDAQAARALEQDKVAAALPDRALGFHNGRPVAAILLFRCLQQWGSLPGGPRLADLDPLDDEPEEAAIAAGLLLHRFATAVAAQLRGDELPVPPALYEGQLAAFAYWLTVAAVLLALVSRCGAGLPRGAGAPPPVGQPRRFGGRRVNADAVKRGLERAQRKLAAGVEELHITGNKLGDKLGEGLKDLRRSLLQRIVPGGGGGGDARVGELVPNLSDPPPHAVPGSGGAGAGGARPLKGSGASVTSQAASASAAAQAAAASVAVASAQAAAAVAAAGGGGGGAGGPVAPAAATDEDLAEFGHVLDAITQVRRRCCWIEARQRAAGRSSRQRAAGRSSRQRAAGRSSRQRAAGRSSRQRAAGRSTRQRAAGRSTRQRAVGHGTRRRAVGHSSRHAVCGHGAHSGQGAVSHASKGVIAAATRSLCARPCACPLSAAFPPPLPLSPAPASLLPPPRSAPSLRCATRCAAVCCRCLPTACSTRPRPTAEPGRPGRKAPARQRPPKTTSWTRTGCGPRSWRC